MIWILNPDCEIELSRPSGYTASQPVLKAMSDNASKFSWLTQRDESLFLHELERRSGDQAVCWSPTPSTLRIATSKGYSLPKAPDVAVLRTVNSKTNLQRSELPGPQLRSFAKNQDEFAKILEVSGGNITVRTKRLYGFAGRNQRRLSPPLGADDLRYLSDSYRQGGLLVESEQKVFHEWSIHGVVWGGERHFGGASRFDLTLGDTCRIVTDTYGAVVQINRDTSAPSELVSWSQRAGRWLFEMGYFGPFGLDVIEGDHGLVASDLNARFTLGWSVGLGESRASALERMFH
jgi:hypothetical protein